MVGPEGTTHARVGGRSAQQEAVETAGGRQPEEDGWWEKPRRHEEEDGEVKAGFMDPERLVQCPYDKNHQIRASRFPYHLVKCRQNNQKIARALATCPYNARHRVPKQELSLHIATCENKVSPEVNVAGSTQKNDIKESMAWQCPPPEEDWEAGVIIFNYSLSKMLMRLLLLLLYLVPAARMQGTRIQIFLSSEGSSDNFPESTIKTQPFKAKYFII
ncbi:gametocyte-specific factor 1 isoform X2 [Hemicordylus capensis]|uniref:gametocyte-specific factor 1 isoform X2 n=1 Tax=Hemicordylus capensis TaxID=884348 RepID=UPI002304370F|nr:gametocyte-specific factor 1 isoform X2 [Hemicordylus capensis]